MARTEIKSVDDYMAAQSESMQGILSSVRNAIRKAVPSAEESISYRIPTYKLAGRPVLHFAGWTQHYSLYPASAGVIAAFKDDLAPYAVAKGTIRFPRATPVPVRLIEKIARFRAKEVSRREKD